MARIPRPPCSPSPEDNARLLRQAGVRWARDVGAPERDGRAVSLTVRDSWRGRRKYPYVRAAGTWIMLPGARVAAEARVDCVEHGFTLDADTAAAMAAGGVALVATLAVLESWQTFGATTEIRRFTSEEGRAAVGERRERAHESVRLAHRADVLIAAGTDFGGGSLQANQLRPHPRLPAARWAPSGP